MSKTFKNMNMEGADVWYCNNFFDNHKELYNIIDKSVNWSVYPVKVMGKVFDSPRMNFYMADDYKHPYRYSGYDRIPQEWSEELDDLRTELWFVIKQIDKNHPELNAVLGNKYNDGTQYIGEHQDSEKDLIKKAFIVSISLGAIRDFIFKNIHTGEKIIIPLESGSIILMGGDCQKNWKHSVPKRLLVKDARINLTFRCINPRI
jgi:alkylated DNA repair dioxygenase AlkB